VNERSGRSWADYEPTEQDYSRFREAVENGEIEVWDERGTITEEQFDALRKRVVDAEIERRD
jgi:hypothetical protein